MKTFLFSISAFIALTSSLYAENIQLTADNRVEWHQKENKMVAIGNAVATKGDLSIKSDEMTGFYNKTGDKSNIDTVHAHGNVVLKTSKASGYGDTLDYDIEKDTAVLKGNPAKIKTDSETITATDSITYYLSQNKAIATGDVIITEKDNKVFANELIGYFKKNAKGVMEIDKVDISKNVKITTKQGIVTAKRGTYLPQQGLIKLYENVTLNQDGNILKGDIAESNLNTGVSKLISSSKNGQVSGVFKEKGKEAKDSKKDE